MVASLRSWWHKLRCRNVDIYLGHLCDFPKVIDIPEQGDGDPCHCECYCPYSATICLCIENSCDCTGGDLTATQVPPDLYDELVAESTVRNPYFHEFLRRAIHRRKRKNG